MSTDADYNAPHRFIEGKLELYLNGTAAQPLVITRSNYLIDLDVLDEATTDEAILGAVTSNEISFTLFNENGIFSPTNSSGPYYGLIRKGIKCKAFLRVNEQEWDPVGVFYVTDWQATITGTTVSVYAEDRLYDAFNLPDLDLPIVRDISFAGYYRRIFNALGLTATIDQSLTETLTMAYNVASNKDLLNNLSTGALALCFCDHLGDVHVRSLLADQPVRAILTDADQVIKAEASFGLSTGYDGARLTYHTPQESTPMEVLRVDPITVPIGRSATETMTISDKSLIRILYASLVGSSYATIESIKATSRTIRVTTYNEDIATELPLSVYGTIVEGVSADLGSTAGNALTVDNMYIQTKDYADRFMQVLNAYASNTIPRITITARGNPLLNLGDKIHVYSEKYNINFLGILLKQQFTYNGALTSKMTLLDASVLEVT